MDPENVEVVMSWERPKSVFEIRSFLGLVEYYRRFIEDFSRLSTPMMRLTWKEVKFEWSGLCKRAFQELKRRLTSAPIMIVPKRGRRYTVYCDASKDELGCVLMQSGECGGLWFSTAKEPRAELPYTWHGVGSHCLFIKGLVPLFI